MDSFDLLEFRTPPGTRESLPGNLQFTRIDGGSFCRYGVFQSVAGLGNPAADYLAEWTQVAKARGTATPPPQPVNQTSVNGWRRFEAAGEDQSGASGRYRVRFVAFSGTGRRISAVAYYNNDSLCQRDAEAFLASLQPKSASPQVSSPKRSSGFAFHTTNFDDGWTAVEQPDWVQVTKGNVTVLIHHARPDIRDIVNVEAQTSFVWNQLVAPRYANATNVWMRKGFWSDGYTAQHFGEADVTDRASGRKVHVALHRGGNGRRWIEFITPDKATFEREFGRVFEQDGTNWDRLSSMAGRNKFAVAASDLPGLWASSSGAGVEYVNAYTGNSLGMSSVSNSDQFTFEPGGAYTSVYKGVSSSGGANRYYGETYKGNYTVDRWQMTLTNRFKGATETFAVQFEAVQGGRALHMTRGNIEQLILIRAAVR